MSQGEAHAEPTAGRPPRIALFGLGGVGRAFLEIAGERPGTLRLVAAADSRGALIGDLDPGDVLERKAAGHLAGNGGVDAGGLIAEVEPDIVVDTVSCDFASGEPSLSILRAALDSGRAAVTANKAPLARAWRALAGDADRARRIGYAAAAGAALPAVAVARALRREDDVASLEAVLTGTTTFVLEAIAGGASVEDASRGAQAAGIAEPDPSIDLGGWDTAAKVVILANTLWPDGLELDSVDVSGIEAIDAGEVRTGTVRLVGRAERTAGGVCARVGVLRLEDDHPLARLRGSEKGVVFRGPGIGEVVVTGGRSHPRGAAGAAFGDVLELAGGLA
jgi:homoserine dehydrogenase